MTAKRTGMTLAEHHAKLKAEGKWEEFVARRMRSDEAIAKSERESAVIQAPLVETLKLEGVLVRSVWDLLSVDSASYVHALPILLEHLQRDYPDGIREGIARAMATSEASFAWPVLAGLYKKEAVASRTKMGLALALANSTTGQTFDKLIELLHDASHGESRVLLLGAVARTGSSAAMKVLLELGSDEVLGLEVQRILRLRKRATKYGKDRLLPPRTR